MTAPLVSIIIPAYNYAHYLPFAVSSALAQQEDGCRIEIIIVDDGSTDDTPDIAKKLDPAVRYIRQGNQGLSAARNTGVRAATGDFLLFLDADDILGRGCVASQLANFAEHPKLDISVCLCFLTFPPGSGASNYFWPLLADHLDLHLCHGNISPVHTFLTRARVIREIGFFDTGLEACEDQDYWLRCAAQGKNFAANPGGVVFYRQHGESMSGMSVGCNLRQLAHDANMHFRVEEFLKNIPAFPKAGKGLGWMAHAAGTGLSAVNLAQDMPKLCIKLLDTAGKAMLTAAAINPQADRTSPHLAAAELFYAARFLLVARYLGGSSVPDVARAQRFIEHRYPRIAAHGDEFLQKNYIPKMLRRLSCEASPQIATLKMATREHPPWMESLFPDSPPAHRR